MSKSERKAKFLIILGTNGTGKSTLVRRLANSSRDRVLIITPDYSEWPDIEETMLERPEDFEFTGIRKHIFREKHTLPMVSKHVYNTFLIFDDCRSYLTASTDLDMKSIWIRRRQKMNDVAMVGHGFTEVPPRAFTFCSEIALFRTTDNLKTRKSYIQKYDMMVRAQEKVNKKAKENPHYFEIIRQ